MRQKACEADFFVFARDRDFLCLVFGSSIVSPHLSSQDINSYSILVGNFLVPGILCSKTFLLGQTRKKGVMKSLFVSAANFFQKQLQ